MNKGPWDLGRGDCPCDRASLETVCPQLADMCSGEDGPWDPRGLSHVPVAPRKPHRTEASPEEALAPPGGSAAGTGAHHHGPLPATDSPAVLPPVPCRARRPHPQACRSLGARARLSGTRSPITSTLS